jgi:hypothetical protein
LISKAWAVLTAFILVEMTGTNSTRASFSKIRYVLATVITGFLDFNALFCFDSLYFG